MLKLVKFCNTVGYNRRYKLDNQYANRKNAVTSDGIPMKIIKMTNAPMAEI